MPPVGAQQGQEDRTPTKNQLRNQRRNARRADKRQQDTADYQWANRQPERDDGYASYAQTNAGAAAAAAAASAAAAGMRTPQQRQQQQQQQQQRQQQEKAEERERKRWQQEAQRDYEDAMRDQQRRYQEQEDEAARVVAAEALAAHERRMFAAVRHASAKESSDPASKSNVQREKANTMYKGLESLSPGLQPHRLHTVMEAYKDALRVSTTPLERALSAKNLAITLRRSAEHSHNSLAALTLQVEALSYYAVALKEGDEVQTSDWLEALWYKAYELLTEAAYPEAEDERLHLQRPPQRSVLHRLCVALPTARTAGSFVSSLKMHSAMYLAKELFTAAEALQDTGRVDSEWRAVLSLLAEAVPLVELVVELAQLWKDVDMEQEGLSMQEGLHIAQQMCHSLQARTAGEALLKNVMAEHEELNMEGVFIVIDKLKEAMVAARGSDLECEAVASCLLGRVWQSVLKDGERSRAYYRQTLELGQAMAPVVVSNRPWYQEARTAIQEWQQKQVEKEEADNKREKGPLLEELAVEIAALQAAAKKGAHVLVKHVYTVHLPPGSKATVPTTKDLGGDCIKDTVKQAILLYHPDKQAGRDAKWRILAEQICIELNVKYTSFK